MQFDAPETRNAGFANSIIKIGAYTWPGDVLSAVCVVWLTVLPSGSYCVVVVMVVVPVGAALAATLCTARLSPSYWVVEVRFSASSAKVWLPAPS